MSNKYIFGEGIEIGALHCPLWVNDQARVKYVDILPDDELKKRYPEIHDPITHVDLIDSEKLEKIDDGSLDFIIANHFFEHAADPIGTLKLHFEKIKTNGHIFYAIPNKMFTFDKHRVITPFNHILQDYQDSGESSKFSHYLEWAEIIEGIKNKESAIAHANHLIKMDNRIHFHVWDLESFEGFINNAVRLFEQSFKIVHLYENVDEIIVILKKVR